MAFLANDPNREIDEKNVSMNVVNPTDQGQAKDTSSEAQNQPQTGATAGSSTIQASDTQGSQQAPQSAGRRPSEGGKGSSGQFTNIRKYIEANKPQATKMAGAAGAQTQKQSQAIGQQVQQQKQQLQQQIQQNQAKLGQAKKFSDQQLWLAGGMQPDSSGNVPKTTQGDSGLAAAKLDREAYAQNQNRIKEYEQAALGDKYSDYMSEYNVLYGRNPDGSPRMTNHRFISPSEQEKINQEREANLQALRNEYFGEGQYGKLKQEDIARFRNLATGQEAFNDVQQMNLAKQQVAARRLQQQAGAAGTEQGRRDLLKQAFGRGGRQYTRGQQGLDDIIVSGSAEARKQLVDQTRGAAEAAQSGIKQAQQQQLRDIAGLEQQGQQFRTGLEEQTTGAQQGIVTEADAALKAAKAAREEQLAQLEAAQGGLQGRVDALRAKLDMGNKANRERLMRDLQFFKEGDFDTEDSQFMRNQMAKQFIETGDRAALQNLKHKMGGQHLDAMLRNSVLGELGGMGKDLSLLGIDPNLYGGSFDAEYNNLRKAYDQTAYGTDIGDLITGGGGRKYLDAYRVFDEFGALGKKLNAFSAEDLLQKQLGDVQGGLSLKEFREGADLTRESVVDPNQIAKYQALSQLAGTSGSDLLAERRRDALTQEEFDRYLENLGKV